MICASRLHSLLAWGAGLGSTTGRSALGMMVGLGWVLAFLLLAPQARAQVYTWEMYAGSFAQMTDAEAQPYTTFTNMAGLAVDSDDNLWASDSGYWTLRKFTATGTVEDISAFTNPRPTAVAVDAAKNVYFFSGHQIYKVTGPSSVVVYAGTINPGAADGPAANASFDTPAAMAFDDAGNLFVADKNNHAIRRVSASGDVTTLAGSLLLPGFVNGTGAAARFRSPSAICTDAAGNVYVGDSGNDVVRKITPAGLASTYAGTGVSGFLDGPANQAKFSFMGGMVMDPAGNLFVTDGGSVRKVSTDLQVTSFGTASGAIAIDSAGTIYATNQTTISKISRTSLGVIQRTLGGPANVRGHVDGTGPLARFDSLGAMSVAADETLYVVDNFYDDIPGHTVRGLVRKISPTRQVTTLDLGSADHNHPLAGLGLDAAGGLYFTGGPPLGTSGASAQVAAPGWDSFNPVGMLNGALATARFRAPWGIAATADGTTVFVVDAGNKLIRKVTGATVTTLAGNLNTVLDSHDGEGAAASFGNPRGIALDLNGDLIVTDGQGVRRVTQSGTATTISPGANPQYYVTDGIGQAASMVAPTGVAVTPNGNIIFTDTDAHLVRMIVNGNEVKTVGGRYVGPGVLASPGTGNTPGVGLESRFYLPSGVAVSPNGYVYVANAGRHSIMRGKLVPMASSLPAVVNSGSRVTLQASINPNGETATARLEWGTTTSYGNTVDLLLAPANGVTDQVITTELTGLATGVAVYYRHVVSNSKGTAATSIGIVTPRATGILEVRDETGAVIPSGATIDFGDVARIHGVVIRTLTLTNLGDARLSPTVPASIAGGFTAALSNFLILDPGQSVACHIQASGIGTGTISEGVMNISDAGFGRSFSVRLKQNPITEVKTIAKTLAASNIGVTSATLNGQIDAFGVARRASFFVMRVLPGGYDPNSINVPGVPGTVAGTGLAPVSGVATGLLPHTKYSYAAESIAVAGTASGAFVSFTTGNTAPVGVPDAVVALPSSPLTISPGNNDTDADRDVVTVASCTPPAASAGTVRLTSGKITFSPSKTFTGGSFNYVGTDGFGGRTATTAVSLVLGTCSVAPAATVPSDSPAYDLPVTANAPWSVVESLTWVTCTPGANSVRITPAPNPSLNSRTGDIMIGGQKHTLTQLGVAAAPLLQVPVLVPNAVVTAPYDLAIAVQNGPVTFIPLGLPPGLAISSTTQHITGKPTKAGTYAVTLKARNAKGTSAAINFSITVLPYPVSTTGSYTACINGGGVNANFGGLVTFTVASNGSITGKLWMAPSAGGYFSDLADSFTGKLTLVENPLAPDPEHAVMADTPVGSSSGRKLRLRMNTPGPGQVSGEVSRPLASPAVTPATLLGAKHLNTAAFKGKYTVALEATGDETDLTIPQGDGYIVMDIGSTGIVTGSGMHADRQVLTLHTSHVLVTNEVPIYSGGGIFPYMTHTFGSLTKSIALDPTTKTVSGSLRWIKPANASGYCYSEGFQTTVNAVGGLYTGLPAGLTGPARARYTRGAIASDSHWAAMNTDLSISTLGVVTIPVAAETSMIMDLKNGTFSGYNRLTPGTIRRTSLAGVILSAQGRAAGSVVLPDPGPVPPGVSTWSPDGKGLEYSSKIQLEPLP